MIYIYKMNRKQIILKAFGVLLVVAASNSCAILSKSQLAEVNDFGRLTCNFSDYPSKFLVEFNAINQKIEIYRTATRQSSKLQYNDILKSYNRMVKDNTFDDK